MIAATATSRESGNAYRNGEDGIDLPVPSLSRHKIPSGFNRNQEHSAPAIRAGDVGNNRRKIMDQNAVPLIML